MPFSPSLPAPTAADNDFIPLVDHHYQPLLRFALGLARDAAQAADLTQQTFYLWAVRGHQLRERGKAKGWLYTTLYREFLRERRRSLRFRDCDTLDALETLSAPEVHAAPAGSTLDGAAALRAIGEINEAFRAPLRLFYLEDRSYGEIARTLRIPLGTVMSRLSRGKAELRARLLGTGGSAGKGVETRKCRSPAARASSKLPAV